MNKLILLLSLFTSASDIYLKRIACLKSTLKHKQSIFNKKEIRPKKLVDLIREKRLNLKSIPESEKNLFKNYILSQKAPYNVQAEFKSFIKKLRVNGGFIVQNTTDMLVEIQIKYEDQEKPGFFQKNSITINPHEYYIGDKQNDIILSSVKLLDANQPLFLNPKFTEDSFLQITIEATQDRYFLHQYHPFDFSSRKFTDEQLLDSSVADEERMFRNDYNGSCDYLDSIGRQEGISLAEIDRQRRILYAQNNIGSLIKQDPDLLNSTTYRIPLVTHKIWVTSDTDPKDPSAQYIKWLENSIKHNMPSDGWTHYFWIESKEKLPQLARLLENHPTIIVRELKDLDTTHFLTGNLYKKAITEKKFGKATDILRLELLRLYGGYYLDTDYEAFQSLLPYSKAYDLVVGLEPMSVYICNAFIGACPDHPVTNKALELIKRNLSDAAPDYIKRALNNGFKTIVETGPAMFTLAVALAAGKDTQDIILPPQIIYPAESYEYPKKQVVTPDGKIPAQAVGAHYWNTAWMDPRFGSQG